MSAEVTFAAEPINTGYTQVPHGLWTLDVAPGTRLLLGWLHSHSPAYLAKLSVNRIEQEFGGGGSVRVWLAELRDRGFITQEKVGIRWVITLLAEPWLALHRKPREKAEANPADSAPQDTPPIRPPNPADSAPVVDQPEKIKNPDVRFAHIASDASASKDALYAAMCRVCCMDYTQMTDPERKRTGVAVSQIMKVGATVEQVERRAEVYLQRNSSSLTPTALAGQWSRLHDEAPVAQSSPKQNAVNAGIEKARAARRTNNVVPLRPEPDALLERNTS